MSLVKLVLCLLCFTFLCSESRCQSKRNRPSIKVKVIDHITRKPTAVRVKITDSKGFVPGIPKEAISIMYGRDDKPERYGYQPDSTFYINGHFKLDLNPGDYNIALSKGVEFIDQVHAFSIKEGDDNELDFEMERWIKMSDLGWYSADDHIHIRRSPRENPLILKWIEAEGLNVGVLLQMGDFWSTYFSQYAFGEDGVFEGEEGLLSSGQEEPR